MLGPLWTKGKPLLATALAGERKGHWIWSVAERGCASKKIGFIITTAFLTSWQLGTQYSCHHARQQDAWSHGGGIGLARVMEPRRRIELRMTDYKTVVLPLALARHVGSFKPCPGLKCLSLSRTCSDYNDHVPAKGAITDDGERVTDHGVCARQHRILVICRREAESHELVSSIGTDGDGIGGRRSADYELISKSQSGCGKGCNHGSRWGARIHEICRV